MINKESSHLNCWDVNNLYGWAMSQKLPVNNFQWIEDTSQFNKGFMKNYNEESYEKYFLDVDVQYSKKYMDFTMIYHFYQKKWNLDKVEKIVTNLCDENEYVVYIRFLKQALNHGLSLKKIHKVVKFNQKAWLEPYIKINPDLRKIAKNDFEKIFIS